MALKKTEDYELEEGYRLEKVVGGLTYPTNIEFDPAGDIYVAEAGFTYPFMYSIARISRIEAGNLRPVAEGFHGPLIGLRWHDNGFLATHRGTLTRVELDGRKTDIVTDIPSYGDHHTNHIALRDGKVYFGQGSVTNSGVVGADNLLLFGWLVSHREGHDTMPFDVTLSGVNIRSLHPLFPVRHVETGPFMPLGEKAAPGQVVKGQLKCNAVIYRCNPDGSELEVYAWGLRNPFALAVAPDGRLLTIVQGEDQRGSRPSHAPDALYEVREGGWYGWPDFSAGRPIADFMEPDSEAPREFLMATHPPLQQPLHTFDTHSATVSMDFSHSEDFGYRGQAFLAQWGAEHPFTTGGKFVFVGKKVVRLDLATGKEEPFYVNPKRVPGVNGPERPVLTRFSPDGTALYVLDHGLRTIPKSGGLWKITRA